MPVPTTVNELLELVRKSELIQPPRLETFLEQPANRALTNPRDWITALVNAGLITQFQAEQFLQGKWRGFSLGKYRVLERIGSGGMGTVYLCEHMVVGRKVAVKVLPTSQASNPSALGRFYREARAAGVLDHPNLVKAHDIDQDNGMHFLVMDYVDGSSLQDIVSKSGPLSILRACHYIRQAATGLQAAHEAGLVHRDIKPANIMVERDGRIRVLDLGLARFYNDNEDLLTLKYDEKNVLGTADYVAPEQALNSHEVDIRADIYSLGASFYFLLTGQPLFVGGRIAQKLIWHQVRQPTPVRQLRPEVPAELALVLDKMMAKEPEDRYQTPADVAEALAVWTREPVPAPVEDEMPKLSPAAVSMATPTPNPGPATHVRRNAVLPVQRRATGAVTMNAAPESSGRVATLTHPSPTELATPRNLSAQTPTATEHPRPRVPAARSAAETQTTATAAAKPTSESSTKSILGFALLIVLSIAAGVAATAWMLNR